MPSLPIGRFSERIQFFDGQRLFASDLQDLEQFNREMRRLHNQSLHQAGIASGFAVSGARDDREVTIQPGYAIDVDGREIVLTEPLVLQVPPVADDGAGRPVYYDLVVSYPTDAELTENRSGVCVSRHAVRLREEPIVCWAELSPTDEPPGPDALDEVRQAKLDSLNNDIKQGRRLRLARAEVFNCRLNQALSVAQRRNARPAQQPYMAVGRTKVGQTWEAKKVEGVPSITLPLRGDTSGAHFRGPPRYYAHAIGDRSVTLSSGFKLQLDGFWRPPVEPGARSFEFVLFIPVSLLAPEFPRNDDSFKALVDALSKPDGPLKDWYVEWLGVEG